MSLSTLKVFNQFAYSTFLELLAQNIALFNSATQGGIILKGGSIQGDYADEAFYSRIVGLIRRRNAYGSGAVTAKELAHLVKTSVKVAAGTPPVNIDPHWWQWIQRSPEEAGVVLGKQLAEDSMADMLNTGLKCFVAAVGAQAAVVHDGTAGNLSLSALSVGASKFGDRNQDLKCWVMHSKPLFDVFGTAIANANQLFTFGTVKVVQDGFGRPFIVTDAPDLVYTSSGTKYRTLGLVPGAVLIEQNDDYIENVDTKNGDENIQRTWQAQWSFNLGLKGFTWDKTNGGASPSNTALGTATNWDKIATENKDLAGVMVTST